MLNTDAELHRWQPQDVSTMIRSGQNTIIFLINNGGYTIEVEIHDGPYNVIKNWNYSASTMTEANAGLRRWNVRRSSRRRSAQPRNWRRTTLCFIEVIVHKDDTSKELLEWGTRVSAANSRAPNPQWPLAVPGCFQLMGSSALWFSLQPSWLFSSD